LTGELFDATILADKKGNVVTKNVHIRGNAVLCISIAIFSQFQKIFIYPFFGLKINMSFQFSTTKTFSHHSADNVSCWWMSRRNSSIEIGKVLINKLLV